MTVADCRAVGLELQGAREDFSEKGIWGSQEKQACKVGREVFQQWAQGKHNQVLPNSKYCETKVWRCGGGISRDYNTFLSKLDM